ncbi:GWxTD domain-containing protein [candidate division WOR-3 bacterium]|nr:GWxTD domain-containing protein [candidate division WOR-3 bacterium]
MKIFSFLLPIFAFASLSSAGFQIYREPLSEKTAFLAFFRVSSADLIFVRDDSLYKASYGLILEVFDENNDVIHGEILQRKWTLSEYVKTLMRSVTDEYAFSFYVENFTRGKIVMTLSDKNSSAVQQLSVSLERPVKTAGEIILMKNDTIVLGDVTGIGEIVSVFASSSVFPGNFVLKKNGIRISEYEGSVVEFLGIEMFSFTLEIPQDTGVYVIAFENPVDTSERVLMAIDRLHVDSLRIEKMIEELVFAVPPEEYRSLRTRNIQRKNEFLNDFWASKDPTPSTERNEVMETYYRRISFAEERFVEGVKGWRTDRGRVYVLLGLPDEIEDYSFQMDREPYQVWYYYSRGIKFIFVDEHLIGDYELTEPRGWLDVWRSYFDYN